MKYTTLSPDDMDVVQKFAFGGIANPTQRATLRAADREFLQARQAELDAFEQQRQAYNSGLTKYQEEVFKPYQQQVEAYNSAAQQYNTDVYSPYQQQYDAYQKAVDAYNAGDRLEDYSGPAEPVLSKQFEMKAPTTPGAFDLSAPVLPFKEEDIQARQQQAAETAKKDAGNRATAINVASNPEQFNFGSMSVSGRFMAEGGPVDKDPGGYFETVQTPFGNLPGRWIEGKAPTPVTTDESSPDFVGPRQRVVTSDPNSPDFVGPRYQPQSAADLLARFDGKGQAPADFAGPRQQPDISQVPMSQQEQTDLFNRLYAQSQAPAAFVGPREQVMPQPEPARTKTLFERRSSGPIASSPVGSPVSPSLPPAPGKVDAVDSPSLNKAIELLKGGKRESAIAELRRIVGLPPLPAEKDDSGGGGEIDMQVVVYGPDGKMYSSPAQARRAGVTNYTTTPPNLTKPTPPPLPKTPTLPPGSAVKDPTFNPAPPAPFPGAPRIDLNVPVFEDFKRREDQQKQRDQVTNPTNYFAQGNQSFTGNAPGTVGIGSQFTPLASSYNTQKAIGANPTLSPNVLGGQQNLGVMTDRLGNRIYAPAMPMTFAEGGEVEADDNPINTDPLGSAQQFMAQLNQVERAAPTRQSVKRVAKNSDGASSPKGMGMATESLATAKDLMPKSTDKGSSRQQMEDFIQAYQNKISAAKNKARGLAANTMGAPTLEGPALTKNTLAKKRFKDGGEAKKSDAEVAEPGLFGVSDYAAKSSEQMFPGQSGQDDQRDAARHMLAAGTLSRKYGEKTAEFLGKAHERLSNPKSFFNMLGMGEARYDYEPDVHNNRIGAQLGSRAKSQAELEKMVRDMAKQSRDEPTPDRPRTMSRKQLEAIDAKAKKDATPPPEYRAEGSPEEGEVGQAELDAASKPAFVTPKSGKGRKSSTKPGDLEAAALQGVSEMPYNLLGTPVDLATMAMRPFGYSVEAPTFGSEDLKRRATKAGIRQEPPKEGTAARALFNLADIGSSAVNPAAPVRAGVKAAKVVGDKAADVAKDFQQYNRQLDVPGASYAVRPTGSTMASGPIGFNTQASGVDRLLNDGVSNARSAAGQDADMESRIKSFWDTKARNYFTRQFGTPDDPVMNAIAKKRIKSVGLEEMFPEYMIDQINVGKTRVNEQGQERFFPKYPRAMDDFAARYDPATGLKGNVISTDPAMGNPQYEYIISDQGKALGQAAKNAEADRMSMQGLRPELINTKVDVVTRSGKNPDRIIGDGTKSAEDLLRAFEESQAYNKLTPAQQQAWANEQFGAGRNLHGLDYPDVGKNILPDNIRTAIEKGEPVYDFDRMDKPLKALFEPASINAFLATVPAREMKNMRFEDAVAGAVKMNELATQRQVMVDRIKAGKPVPDKVFSEGVSAPLVQFDKDSGLDGFAWKRIEKREATVPEGAYVGHSVGGYETGGAGYSSDKQQGFNTGKWQVYTLRDNRNRPVNTIEVKMLDGGVPVVTQIKGNGRSTGNTAPEKYDAAVLRFLQTHLKPAAIQESDSYLTPLLQNYKTELNAFSSVR
ncbi:hypothetical protein UFOVP652_56 [uncultured Caudovirales phage]|uniref:DUF6973 domain-containing protein n=1 Tax=uncultured Caudovirales phage TaxID=2100421 RepID=A0A6J5NDA6_9CAUD|nr:hypothetical protein UFOVP652_56 [uncultured Caudovirales phage]CAB5224403.1 hypothetical protein UFOVP734_68 [uncultured Caudovirales phage]